MAQRTKEQIEELMDEPDSSTHVFGEETGVSTPDWLRKTLDKKKVTTAPPEDAG